MELDARRLRDGARIDADLCVVGAGPAGIAVASEFIGLGLAVAILESGGVAPEPASQELNEAAALGNPHLDLRSSRHRGAGGAMRLWNTRIHGTVGAKYVPLDPGDFSRHPDLPLSGWPFEASTLEPFYRRAQRFAGLGPFAYGGAEWAVPSRPCLSLPGDQLSTAVYQFGSSNCLGQKLAALRASGNVTLYPHATVCALETDAAGRRIVRVHLTSASGARVEARARLFVLAAGAIENCRLLLVSAPTPGDAPGNRHGWVGRCFMEHPRDRALTLIPRSPDLFREAAFYDAHRSADGTLVAGRIAVREPVRRALRLPNASVTLLPSERTGSRAGALRRRVLERWPALAARVWQGGYGWSRVRQPSRRFENLRLVVNLEQRPHPENRVVLAARRDVMGVPRAELHWSWSPEEEAGLDRLRALLIRGLEAAGLGRVVVEPDLALDPHAHHHAGTTRMHVDARYGVADADARVHGLDNLYLAGASLFPTSGFANPTLTILALSLRLGDHLKQRA